MLTGLLCYVLGCRDASEAGAVRSVRHAAFGRVTACAAHDPNRFDAGQPLVAARVTPAAAVPIDVDGPADNPRDGGARVPVARPAPRVPPAGALLTLPGAPLLTLPGVADPF